MDHYNHFTCGVCSSVAKMNIFIAIYVPGCVLVDVLNVSGAVRTGQNETVSI